MGADHYVRTAANIPKDEYSSPSRKWKANMRKTRYQKKRLHRRKIIRQFEFHWDHGRKTLKQIQMEYGDDPQDPIRYWHRSTLSGPKRIARRETNNRIRHRYRVIVHKSDLEEAVSLRHGSYRKQFDYWWTID